MKIFLIKPHWRVEHQVTIPPLGIMSLAAYVRERLSPAPDVKIIDQSQSRISRYEIERLVGEEKPDIVGFTGLSYEAPALKILTNSVRRILPESVIMVGGPHATVFYDHLLDNSAADVAVLGEGEETFLELVESLRDGSDWRGAAGIAYRAENGEIVVTPPRPPIMDLDSLPYPAWDLVDIPGYNRHADMNAFLKGWPHMPVFASRACPFGCIYCHQIFGKKFRARSVESALEEMRQLVNNHGIKEIHIVDDIFNWDLERAKNICRGVIREKIKVHIAFPNGIRGDRLDDELIELLHEAGCYSMTFAVETASPRLQKMLRKFADLDKLEYVIAKADETGIITSGFFMLGFPTETRREMEDTIDFACRSKILKGTFFTVVPFPRTKLYDAFKKNYPELFKMVGEDLQNMHYFNKDSFYQKTTGIDMGEILHHAYRKFYMRPRLLYDIFRKFPWNRRFVRGMYYGFRDSWAFGHHVEVVMARRERKRMGMFVPEDPEYSTELSAPGGPLAANGHKA